MPVISKERKGNEGAGERERERENGRGYIAVDCNAVDRSSIHPLVLFASENEERTNYLVIFFTENFYVYLRFCGAAQQTLDNIVTRDSLRELELWAFIITEISEIN